MPPPLGINGKHYRFVRFDTGGTVNVLNRFEAVSSGAWSPDGIDDLGLPPASHCQFGHKAQTRRCIILYRFLALTNPRCVTGGYPDARHAQSSLLM